MAGQQGRKKLRPDELDQLFAAARAGSAEARAGLINLFRPYLLHVAEPDALSERLKASFAGNAPRLIDVPISR